MRRAASSVLMFIDETNATALRTIDWGVTVASNPARCQRILSGQTVTWLGSFDSHPIQPSGGTLPTPIAGDTLSGATSYRVTFPDIGVYGYECGLHAGMRGAIEVR
jgi:plastocyanin